MYTVELREDAREAVHYSRNEINHFLSSRKMRNK